MAHRLCLLVVLAMAHAGVPAAEVVERVAAYDGAAAPDRSFAHWGTTCEEQPRDGPEPNRCLWLNRDGGAKPWCGITFRMPPSATLPLTPEWIEAGFLRFMVNIGLDRYGNPGGGVPLQVRPETEGLRYQAVRARFIDRGRGTDEDTATWQEVLVPLSYWTELRQGMTVAGLSIQCRGQPARAYALDGVGFVRYDRLPDWYAAKADEDVAQPHVVWPQYTELPSLLQADRHPPVVRDGRFAWPDGRRVFVLNLYMREDPRLDLWGTTASEKRAPSHGLYDPQPHGWIYQELPTAQSLCRLGVNSYSATMPAQPWWDLTGYGKTDNAHDAARLPGTYRTVKLPFYVDTVAWPWTLGAPGAEPGVANALPAEALTQGRHHWTPYRIIGAGREAWLAMWRLYAQRYRDAAVPVLAFELMNEPAYTGISDDHRPEFAQWLRTRHGTIARLNDTWQTDLPSWEAAADLTDDPRLTRIPGRFFDYDEYLAERFTDLVAQGVELVSSILPDSLVGLQTMGGYALSPREAVWKHRICQHETVVLTPTGGGRWTQGDSAAKPRGDLLRHPMAGTPMEDDLLLALADSKPLYDNETYLRGQTAADVRNRLWEHVIAGLDGLTVFSWSKRGWAWWKHRAQVQTEADKFPYCALNPIARRTEALRGILDFAMEVQPLADRILEKPWGPAPRIGLLYDWSQARRKVFVPEMPDKTPFYHAALRLTHWNMAVIPSDRFVDAALPRGPDVLLLGGVRYAEPALVPRLRDFVADGGALIIAEALPSLDLYGHAIPGSGGLAGVDLGPDLLDGERTIPLPRTHEAVSIPGVIPLRTTRPRLRMHHGTEALFADSDGEPVVTKRRVGKGVVYFQAADVVGYALAKLLWGILLDAAAVRGHAGLPHEWRVVETTEGPGDQLAPNLLVSRRSYGRHHALLLQNRDDYAKSVRLRLPGLTGSWRLTDSLGREELKTAAGNAIWSDAELRDTGWRTTVPPGATVVFLLERPETTGRE